MRYWFIGVVVFILILLVPIGVWLFRVETAEIKGKGDAEIQLDPCFTSQKVRL